MSWTARLSAARSAALPPPERGRVGVEVEDDPHPPRLRLTGFGGRPPLFKGRFRLSSPRYRHIARMRAVTSICACDCADAALACALGHTRCSKYFATDDGMKRVRSAYT